MDRPKINPLPDDFDKLLDALGIAGLVLLIGLPVYYYSSLPDIIPHHYNARGEPDGFGDKGIIWTLPGLGIALFIFLSALKKTPHIFNYAVKITEENAEKQYGLANKMLRAINAIITCSFAFISYGTIRTALGKQAGMGDFFLPVFLVLLFGTLGYFTLKSFQHK